MISPQQYNTGLEMLKKLLKEVKIKVEGTKVIYTQVFELNDETLAKTFAEGLRKQYE